MTAADRLMMLDIMYEVKVTLHPDGARLAVTGPAATLPELVPMLRLHKLELLTYLRQTATQRTA